jgi:hypothetical protein
VARLSWYCSRSSAMGRKASDEFTPPLCETRHRHNDDETATWVRQAIDPIGTSRKLWVSMQRIP